METCIKHNSTIHPRRLHNTMKRGETVIINGAIRIFGSLIVDDNNQICLKILRLDSYTLPKPLVVLSNHVSEDLVENMECKLTDILEVTSVNNYMRLKIMGSDRVATVEVYPGDKYEIYSDISDVSIILSNPFKTFCDLSDHSANIPVLLVDNVESVITEHTIWHPYPNVHR